MANFTREQLKGLKEGATKLQRKVINVLLDQGDAEEIKNYMSDLMQHGCISGMVGELVHYRDTVAFYEKYKKDIINLLNETINNTGLQPSELFRNWDKSDPLAHETHNQNLLAWFAFEETTRNIGLELGLDL